MGRWTSTPRLGRQLLLLAGSFLVIGLIVAGVVAAPIIAVNTRLNGPGEFGVCNLGTGSGFKNVPPRPAPVASSPVLALFLLPFPPILAFGGTLAALLDRKVGVNSKVVWAVGSALFGVVCVPALFVLVILIAGP